MNALPRIHGPRLAAFASEGAGRKASVIVEAAGCDLPPPKVRSVRPGVRARDLLPPAHRAAKAAASPTPEIRLQDLEDTLEELGLLEDARPHTLAGAYVVEVTAAQLQRLAEAPGVGAIRLNLRRRKA